MTYKVEVEETLTRTVEVKAESENEALIKAERAWHAQEIVLDARDFLDVEFHILPQKSPAKQVLD